MVCKELPELKKEECLVCLLGTVAFPEAMDIEHRLSQLRFEEKIGDVLLIFEHPPTITLGKFGDMKNVLLSSSELERRNVAFYHSDRGGDATFNCPGQIVIHPIVGLKRMGARAYIAALEETARCVLLNFGIVSENHAKHPGIWVNGKQIGAIGLHLRHGVSMHGMSLNVNPDLESFQAINLCGLPGMCATSIEYESGKNVSVEEVNPLILDSFSNVFNVNLLPISKAQIQKICFEPPVE